MEQTIYSTISINPLTSPMEGVSLFTSSYLSAGATSFGEAKGLILKLKRFNPFKDLQLKNFSYINMTFLVLNLERFNSFNGIKIRKI